jgi:Immunoglobulin I-set domain/Bacterial Ig domain/Immunoglobulin domain
MQVSSYVFKAAPNRGAGWPKFLAAALICLFWLTQARGIQPVVAIHDSELTRALESITATNTATPNGPGTTGFQWWPTNWHYFVMPDSVKEMLHSDGTPYAVVSDANITAGSLLDSNGLPVYPILISLAAEAIRDDEIAPLTNYVAAGGFLFIGSSAFTRQTNGATRGDFALAVQMGLHMVATNLTNWQANSTFTAVSSHQIIANIPQSTLTWQMPSSSEEISWPESNHVAGPPSGLLHLLWQVRPAGATVLAIGDSRPRLLITPYGKGYFIYDATMQPLLGHGGWAPGMYAYGIYRNAIQWAFQTQQLAVPRLSAWPYPYDAAVMFRHDMEAIPSLINSIEISAQYEFNHGAAGDYYFCTGELREDMTNVPATVASLQRSVSNYNASVSSHNGGLTNINAYIPPLTTNSYDYWHWGPDEVLNLNPPGYTNGQAYALASLSNSFSDIQGWIPYTNNSGGFRQWVAPYFNATREASLQLEEQLGLQIVGDDKLGPFPHRTLSTQTPDKLYAFITLPVSDWFVGSQVAQAMEDGYDTNVVHAMVDFYYGLGALINLYSHSSSDGSGDAGNVASEYVKYSLAKPRIWSANAAGIYNWWQSRLNAQVAPVAGTNATQSVATLAMTNVSNTNTAVEVFLPNNAYYALQVSTNGVAAGAGAFRTNGQLVRVLAGTSVTNAQVSYSLPPTAQNNVYAVSQISMLSVNAPGVLGNDLPGTAGTNLTASQTTVPAHGALTLNTNGGFTYFPDSAFAGVDSFNYQVNDAQTNSTNATASIVVTPDGYLFWDDFSRPPGSSSIAPWVQQLGSWSLTNETMVSTSVNNSYGYAYYNPVGATWTNYTVQARIQFSTNSAYGGGIGARLDPRTGAHYAAWVYPENSFAGSAVLKLVKFEGWATWSFSPMQLVSLPSVGTNWHTVTLALQGTNLTVYFDGVQKISTQDNNYDNVPAYTSGGVSADLFTYPGAYTKTMDSFVVAGPNAPVVMLPPVSQTNNAGTTATFTVTALGPGLTYQWLKGTTPISGATSSTLTLNNVLGANDGNYSVVVSNSTASVTSSPAALTVVDPFITGPPPSQTNNAGSTVNFSVTAIGSTTLRYRWFKNNVALSNGGKISGATTSNLTLTGVLGADAGNYTVVVTNNFGMATNSPPAVLTVIDPFITSPPVSRTNNPGTTASFTVAAAGTATLNYRWYKNGGLLSNIGNISGATTTNLVISSVSGGDAAGYTVVVSNSFGLVTNSPPAFLTVSDPFITSQPASETNNAGTTATFTVTATGTPTLNYHWFKNGAGLNDGGNVSGSATASLTLTNVLGADDGAYTVVVSNSVGSVTNQTPAVLTVIDPIITAQPVSLTNSIGTTASFSVGAYGTTPLYQWLKGGVPISGATNATFTIASVTTNDAASYSAVVSNFFGNPVSSNAVLTVVSSLAFQSVTVSNGIATLTWTSVNGLTYRLQYIGDLTTTNWINVVPDVLATGPTASATNDASAAQRFYRVMLLP